MRFRLASSILVLTATLCCAAAHAGPETDIPDGKHIPYEPAPRPLPVPVPAPAPALRHLEKVVEHRSFLLRDETSNDGGYLSGRHHACENAKDKLRDYLESDDRCATANQIPARATVLEATANGFSARCSCDELDEGSDCYTCSARGEVRCEVTYEIYRLVPGPGPGAVR